MCVCKVFDPLVRLSVFDLGCRTARDLQCHMVRSAAPHRRWLTWWRPLSRRRSSSTATLWKPLREATDKMGCNKVTPDSHRCGEVIWDDMKQSEKLAWTMQHQQHTSGSPAGGAICATPWFAGRLYIHTEPGRTLAAGGDRRKGARVAFLQRFTTCTPHGSGYIYIYIYIDSIFIHICNIYKYSICIYVCVYIYMCVYIYIYIYYAM